MAEKQIKILFVGTGAFPMYERAFLNAAIELGYNARLFSCGEYFQKEKGIGHLIQRAEGKFCVGPYTRRLNRDLIRRCNDWRPDLVFLYTCRLVTAKTVAKLKSQGFYVASYCNDDPFASYFPSYFWRNYREALPYCDVNYIFRGKNRKEVRASGGGEAKLLRAYYIDDRNHPCGENEKIAACPDVLFLGHIEKDERVEYLKALADAGIQVGLNAKEFRELEGDKRFVLIKETRDENYNRLLASCKIPLVFLSKINSDTYTRRCFEIPAAGAFLFCPYTDDLASMFEEDKEIVFYRSKEDFVQKVQYYLIHDEERKAIAKAGYDRLHRDGHEAKDRVKQVIADYLNFMKEKA